MPKSRIPYPPEFRQQMIELVRSGRSPGSLAKEFEPSAQTIQTWVKQADLDSGRRHDGLTSSERAEIRRLRRHRLAWRFSDIWKAGIIPIGGIPPRDNCLPPTTRDITNQRV